MMGDGVPWVCRPRGDQQSAARGGALLLQLLPGDDWREQPLRLRAGGKPVGKVSGGGGGVRLYVRTNLRVCVLCYLGRVDDGMDRGLFVTWLAI